MDPPLLSSRGRLGEYRIVRKIADGAHASVKLGVHTLTNVKVALKFMSKRLIPIPSIDELDMRTRVEREIQYLRNFRHPHIIKLYEVIDTRKHVVMVMEYAEGELFYMIAKNGRLPESEARTYFQQIMYALAYSHSMNVVHRDLKPENVLLDDELNVKLADFGLSNEWHDSECLMTGCGTPNYCAPEIIKGEAYGVEIDVWSSGAILFVMTCGRLPFENDDVGALFRQIIDGNYELPDYLSENICSLIRGMMTVNPLERLSVSEVLDHPWMTEKMAPKYLRRSYQNHAEHIHGPVVSMSNLLHEYSVHPDLDETIISELVSCTSASHEDIRNTLLVDGPNAVKVAYDLCADRRQSAQHHRPKKRSSRPFLINIEESDTMQQVNGLMMNTSLEASAETVASEGSAPPSRKSSRKRRSSFDRLDNTTFEVMHSGGQDDSRLSQRTLLGSPLLEAPFALPESVTPPRRNNRTRNWHFGIRSTSPPMEVIHELYKSMQRLGIEWREKRGIWATSPERDFELGPIEQARGDDLDIFTIDIRWRKRAMVALITLRLYKVASTEELYLVDFVYRGQYKASADPNAASRFEPERPNSNPSAGFMNPFLFFECASELITELTGSGD
ncbi:kinase-like domain-containing protein [Cantharellus anzutake]|uniref:kinase-like domain-containing protein n=1 Tax=Cantharellus anzutake TaxID=1750568 RepID=UPI00190538B1|nr:kinase-like domain-containing protein [Cantharellus anzutake]KAF8337977.1 kinase-like domain-containing protein [Cantharellus anzutake]